MHTSSSASLPLSPILCLISHLLFSSVFVFLLYTSLFLCFSSAVSHLFCFPPHWPLFSPSLLLPCSAPPMPFAFTASFLYLPFSFSITSILLHLHSSLPLYSSTTL